MAVLTRPLFHSQERIDLEDLNQLLSGLRTDARLWTRQLYADKNFIVKGFDVTGLGTNALTVNLLDSTLLFAGRRDLTGTASIGVDDAAVVGDTVTIANSDGTEIVLTAVVSGNTGTTFGIGSNAATLAANLGEAIALSSNDLSTSVDGTTITVTASRTGYITIVASNTAPFNNTGNIIGTFDYTSTSISSPADLSYFIIESDATTDETRLTREIAASERAATGTASRTLFVYGTLVTEQGTPITKAFWDPSANSGSGAEFNQRVDTSVDTAMQLNVSTSKLNQATDADAETFFANVAICEIDVDTSGIILAIRDTRPLLFEADDERPWERTNAFATIGAAQTVTDVTVTTIINSVTQAPNTLSFTLDEVIDVYPIVGTDPAILTSARITAVSGIGANQTLEVGKLSETSAGEPGLSEIPAAQRIIIGRTSGAIKIVNAVTSNFFRDDKSLGDFRNAFSALATEINNVKGTENWYEDPPATIKDILRFINSTIIGIQPNARYEWNATGTGDGTLQIKLDPINDPANETFLTLNANNTIAAGSAVTFTGSTTVVLRAITSGSPTNIQYLVGSDSEATASNIAGAINGDGFPNLSASFAETSTTGEYKISLFSNDRNYSTVVSSSANLVVTGSPFTYLGADTDLANIRFYGLDRKFIFREISLTINNDEVLFVTLPDFDTDTSTSDILYTGTPFRYAINGPTVDRDTWNSTNRNIFVNDTDKFKTVPIADFECNERTYWIAFRDSSETLYVRDVGELGNNESANIGQGITNATLSYIGAPDENDSTPEYASVTTINAFSNDGVYTAGVAADVNESIVAQSENLTSAINDLNNHLTSIKNTQYQNIGAKLINGGFFTWNASTGLLSTTDDAYISLPGLTDNRNTISPFGAGSGLSIVDGSLIYVDINRQDNRPDKSVDTEITPVVDTIDLFTPTRDRLVIARRIGDFVYVGINGTIRLATGQSAPLDSALQFLGLTGNQLPRQLNTHLQNTGTINARAVDVGNGDAVFPVGGLSTSGTFDDDIQLTIPINSGILFWEGATFDIFDGRVFNEGTTTNWRSRTPADTTFTAASSLFNASSNPDGEVYYAISIDGETTIAEMDTEISVLNNRATNVIPVITPVIGRKKGEFNITVGTVAAAKTGNTDRAIPPDFGGSIPIALVRVTATGGTVDNFDADTLTVLGSAGGGGGGGSGDASQDLNNYLNRLNLSTYEYFTPIIPSISTEDNVDAANSDAGRASTGISLIKDTTLTTENMLDDEFLAESITPVRVEVEAFWGANAADSSITRIDPNAKWTISYSDSDTNFATQFTPISEALSIPVLGFINNNSILIGQNLSNLSTDNVIFADNHGLSTGHKINLSTLGGLTPTDPDAGTLATTTQFYVNVIDNDAFSLHNTVASADAGDNLIALNGTTINGSEFNRDAGIIDRVGVTNAVKGTFDTRIHTLDGNAYSPGANGSVRLRVVGDTDADIRTQSNDALMTSLALFYSFEGGVEGVNPNSVPDISTLLSDNHLGAGSPTPGTESTTVSRAVAGRGILLKDSGTGTPLREIAIIDGVLSVTDDTGEFQAIAARDAEGNLIVP